MAFGVDDAFLALLSAGPQLMQLFGKSEQGKTPMYGRIPTPGNAQSQQPQGMSVAPGGQPNEQMMTMQLLLGIMSQLPGLFQSFQGGGGMQQPRPQQQPWNSFNQPPGVG